MEFVPFGTATFYVNDMNMNKLSVTTAGSDALNLTIWFESSGIEVKVS